MDYARTLRSMFNFIGFFVAFAWMAVPSLAVFEPTSKDELESAVDACKRMSLTDALDPHLWLEDVLGETALTWVRLPIWQI